MIPYDPHHATRTLKGVEILAIAEQIARNAHDGQQDKAGFAYIGHPERVAQNLLYQYGGEYGQALAAIGWLHDVLEDTPVTSEFLYDNGLPASIVRAVEDLTRREGQTGSQYYFTVRYSPMGLPVKLADIADNSNARRLSMLDSETQLRLIKKYSRAIEELTE